MVEYYEIQRIDKGILYIHQKKIYSEKQYYTALVPQIFISYNRSFDMEQFIIS